MALIQNVETGDIVNLMDAHYFGREQKGENSTVLDDPGISRIHASFFWTGRSWVLQDTSKNGTYINHNRCQRMEKTELKEGDLISFGSEKAVPWKLINCSAPKSILVPMKEGLTRIEVEGVVALPSEDEPNVMIYMAPNGQWVCESQHGVVPVKSGELIEDGDNVWRFLHAKLSVETRPINIDVLPKVDECKFHFSVSQDEEHVVLKLELDNCIYDLKERNHHYLLLYLARQRIEDKKKEIDMAEQGWVDKQVLCKMLGQTENHLNIQVFRQKKQILSVLPDHVNLPHAIEKRAGQVRFAYTNIDIVGGLKLSG